MDQGERRTLKVPPPREFQIEGGYTVGEPERQDQAVTSIGIATKDFADERRRSASDRNPLVSHKAQTTSDSQNDSHQVPTQSSADAALPQSGPKTVKGVQTYPWYIHHHRRNLILLRRKPTKGLGRLGFNAAAHRRSNFELNPQKPHDEEKLNDADPRQYRLEISFAELQRMRLRKLQYALVKRVSGMYFGDEEEPADWEAMLQQYIEAYRDYEYMTNIIHTEDEDPFIATTEDPVVLFMAERVQKRREERATGKAAKSDTDDELIKEWEWESFCSQQRGLQRSKPSVQSGEKSGEKAGEVTLREDDELIPTKKWIDVCEGQTLTNWKEPTLLSPPIGGTRRAQVEKKQARGILGRLLVAALGAVFLIAPMWIMAVVDSLGVALVTTTVFVLVWGVLVAWRLDSPKEVLATTAAYAAVLVVFVGTSTSSTSSALFDSSD